LEHKKGVNNMKEEYKAPILDIIYFTSDDVITTSGDPEYPIVGG
jgi:hypothetical protein